MTEPYSPVPASSSAGERTQLGCLAKGLMALGALVILAGGAMAVMLLLSRNAFNEVKPDALRIANEFAACSLASDRACIKRLSTWDDAIIDKGAGIMQAVNDHLGRRGTATLDEKSVRYRRNAGLGQDSLRWHIEFILSVPYEKDPGASESFVMEDRGQGLKVVRLNWHSDQLLAH